MAAECPGRWCSRCRGGGPRAAAALFLLLLWYVAAPAAAAPAAAPPLVTWFGWAAAGLAVVLAMALVHFWGLHRRVRQRTAALGASEQRLQLALEAGRIAIWEHDMQTDQVTWWGSVEIIFGQPLATLQERPDFYRAMVPPEELPVIDRALQAAMEGDGRFEVLHRMRWADGSDQWMEARGEVMRDAGGQPVRMAGTVVNVTRQVQTQAELAGARDFLQAIYDASPDMIFVHGDDGRLVEVNDNALQAYGYTREEMLASPAGTFMCGDCDMEKVQALMRRARAGEAVDVEWTARRRDGTGFPVEVRLRRLASGEVLALARDISERRAAEAALRAHGERLRQLLATTMDGFILADTDGRIIEVNAAYCAIVGYPAARLLEMSIFDLEAALGPEDIQARIGDFLRQGHARFETAHRHRDGHAVPLDVSLTVLHLEQGPLVAAFVRDISEAKQVEALRERQHRALLCMDEQVQRLLARPHSLDEFHDVVCSGLRALVEADLAAVPLLREDGTGFVYVAAEGAGAPRLRGRQFTLAEGGLCGWVVAHDQALRVDDMHSDPRVEHDLARALDLKAALLVPLHADGRVAGGLSAFRRSRPFDEVDEQMLALYVQRVEVALENLRLRLNLERLVEERTRHLVLLNRELEAFSYSVSHDLRAPLRALDGYGRILIEDYRDRLDAQGREYLDRIRSAARRMSDLIDGLLELSRIGRASLQPEAVDLCELAAEVMEELQAAEPHRKVEFRCTVHGPVQGDRRLLRAALGNLLGNAWKYTREKARAKIELGEAAGAGGREFYVRDNGVGFDMRYADKLFGVFQRMHPPTRYEGTGIGLATVQRIVHRHGGRIRAEAQPGKGAVFRFTLGRQPASPHTAVSLDTA